MLIEVEEQHPTLRISLELSEQEHKDRNGSVLDDNSNSMAQERFIPATPKDFVSILILQSSWWEREIWLLCLVCLSGVSWLLSGSSSWCHGFVCSLWLWYFLIIPTFYFCNFNFNLLHKILVGFIFETLRSEVRRGLMVSSPCITLWHQFLASDLMTTLNLNLHR